MLFKLLFRKVRYSCGLAKVLVSFRGQRDKRSDIEYIVALEQMQCFAEQLEVDGKRSPQKHGAQSKRQSAKTVPALCGRHKFRGPYGGSQDTSLRYNYSLRIFCQNRIFS